MNNIFLSEGIKGQFIGILYRKLMTREEVSYKDVYQCYKPSVDDNYLKLHSLSNEEHYRKLVKAFLDVKNALDAYEPGCIVSVSVFPHCSIARKLLPLHPCIKSINYGCKERL